MIEKILLKIKKLILQNEEEANACYPSAMARESAYYECKEIVQEVAKEYGKDTNVGKWIPVEEKNPTLFDSVYVTCISLVDERPPWVIEGIYGTEGWHGLSYMLRWGEAKVIAWMPKELPAPYQKGE